MNAIIDVRRNGDINVELRRDLNDNINAIHPVHITVNSNVNLTARLSVNANVKRNAKRYANLYVNLNVNRNVSPDVNPDVELCDLAPHHDTWCYLVLPCITCVACDVRVACVACDAWDVPAMILHRYPNGITLKTQGVTWRCFVASVHRKTEPLSKTSHKSL